MSRTSRLIVAASLAAGLTACGAGAPTGDVAADPAAAASPSATADAEAPVTSRPTPSSAAGPDGAGHDHPLAADRTPYPSGIEPARLQIPAIGVDAAFTEPLGMLSRTEMEVPEDPDEAGWFGLSRRPGEIGPAIIAGHVDSRSGPAVFARLRELTAGDEIVVSGPDGEAIAFVVDELGQFPKDALPDEVFSFGGPRPELRLITCGGSFDRDTGHYRDNVIVFAHQAGTAGPG